MLYISPVESLARLYKVQVVFLKLALLDRLLLAILFPELYLGQKRPILSRYSIVHTHAG